MFDASTIGLEAGESTNRTEEKEVARLGNIIDVFGDPASAAAEIGAALHLTGAAAEAEVELAERISRHPRIGDLLRTGAIDLRRAKVIVDGITGVQAEIAEKALDRILPDAEELTTGQIRARLSRVCAELDPETARGRYQAATEQRRIVLSANPDTSANLAGYDLPADLAAAAAKRINWLARKAKTRNDPRTLDQIRADVFLDLLTGRSQAVNGSKPSVRTSSRERTHPLPLAALGYSPTSGGVIPEASPPAPSAADPPPQ